MLRLIISVMLPPLVDNIAPEHEEKKNSHFSA